MSVNSNTDHKNLKSKSKKKTCWFEIDVLNAIRNHYIQNSRFKKPGKEINKDNYRHAKF